MDGKRLECVARNWLFALLIVTVGATTARAGKTYWQHAPATPGDWFVPANWSDGVPDPAIHAYTYIINGGTANISSGAAESKELFVYSSDTSSVTQTGGSLSISETIYLGIPSGTTGTYSLGGVGQLSAGTLAIGHAARGEGHFTQTAGNVDVGLIRFVWSNSNTYDLSGTGVLNAGDVNLEAGIMRQIGATAAVSNDLTLAGTYQLEGAGQLSAKREYIGGDGAKGVMEHSGGTNTVSEALYLGYGGYNCSGTYRLSGNAVLNTPAMFVGWGEQGTFQQSGGTATVDQLHVNCLSRIELSNGALQVRESLAIDNKLDFTGDEGILQIGDNAAANLSQAAIDNVSNGAIIGGTESLIIFPISFDTTALRHYSTAGRTHITGSGDLVISSGESRAIAGKIGDHLICEGSIVVPGGMRLDLNSGLEVSSGGAVNLGDYGKLTVEDNVSGISSGSIAVDEMWLGTTVAEGAFTQSGGTVVADELFISYDISSQKGTYRLSGTGMLTTRIEWIASSVNSNGCFIQEGGTHNTNNIYIAERGVATYEMIGGVLNVADRLRLSDYGGSAIFTQTGGAVNVDNGILVGINSVSDGRYVLNGGTVAAYREAIGPGGIFQQNGGNNSAQWLDIRSGGRFEYTGGALSIGGWTIDGEWDFAAKTATLQATDGAVLDFRLIAPSTVRNAENISFVAGVNSLTIIEPGFDPGSLFNYTTTGLVHTIGETLEVPSGVSLIFSHVGSNDKLDFDDHVCCRGSIMVGGDSYFKGLNLNNGLEICEGGTVDLGKGDVIVNDLISGITSGRLNNRNHGWLQVGQTHDGMFAHTGGTVRIGKLSAGYYGVVGEYELSGGALFAVSLYTGQWGTGTFKVIGDDADINVGTYSQGNGGTLVSEFDAGGVSVIEVSGKAVLDGKWIVVDSGAPFGRFDILTAGDEISGRFDLVNLPGVDWTWGIETGRTLWVEHVPEPAALSLLAVGAMVLIRRHRK